VKIYVAAVEALSKKEREDKNSITTKMVIWVSPRHLNGILLFCWLLLNLTQSMTKLGVMVLSFPYFMDIFKVMKVD
jgi:hypothetical protein